MWDYTATLVYNSWSQCPRCETPQRHLWTTTHSRTHTMSFTHTANDKTQRGVVAKHHSAVMLAMRACYWLAVEEVANIKFKNFMAFLRDWHRGCVSSASWRERQPRFASDIQWVTGLPQWRGTEGTDRWHSLLAIYRARARRVHRQVDGKTSRSNCQVRRAGGLLYGVPSVHEDRWWQGGDSGWCREGGSGYVQVRHEEGGRPRDRRYKHDGEQPQRREWPADEG